MTQDEAQVTVCKKLTREDGEIDWNKTNQEIYNQYRGLTPWPGVWTMWNGKRIKLLRVAPSTEHVSAGKAMVKDEKLFIGCSTGSLEILELQLEGKKAVHAAEFVRGYAINEASLS